MLEILFIIYIVPLLASIVFVYAIIWGVQKSKNPKKYFIRFGYTIAISLLLLSMLFFDYKSPIVTVLTNKDVPKPYKDYPYLSKDTITADFSILYIGKGIQKIYIDSLTNNIIITTQYTYPEDKNIFLRIDSDGNFLGSYSNSHDYYSNGRFLINKQGYSDWFITGDSTLIAYTPITELLNRKSFLPWYNSADLVKYLPDSIFVLHKDGSWYSGKQDFIEYYDSRDKDYPEKNEFAYKGLSEKRADVISVRDPEFNWEDTPYLTFENCPDTIDNGDFLFEYFGKIEYSSGFSHFLSGIGSPTGGGYHPAKWFGKAYCKLRIGNTYVPFVYHGMDLITENKKQYEMNLAIYKGKNYAIIRCQDSTYLIKVKR